MLRTSAQEKWRRDEVEQVELSQEPLSTFQMGLVELAHLLNKKSRRKVRTTQIQTEHEAAVHISESLAHYLRH